jgi:tetratricopeptide (TPR) repeat protein
MKQKDDNGTDGDLREELNVSLINNGREALGEGDAALALDFFERAHTMLPNPIACSFLGYCIATTGGEMAKARSLCEEALREDTDNPVHYLNIGRICLLEGNKAGAIEAFQKGLSYGEDSEIRDEMNKLGNRQMHLVPFLRRSNPVTKFLGLILKKFGFR